MTNWITILLLSLIATGGFIAASYETIARKKFLTVGSMFQKNGILNISGGIIALSSIIYTAFINSWWTIFIVFISAWFFSQVFINLFKSFAQFISIILILVGVIFIIVN